MTAERKDVWASGDAYEPYVGHSQGSPRTTKLSGNQALHLAGVIPNVGPDNAVGACDRRTTFQVGDAQKLPIADASFDATVAGLVINFIPDQAKAVSEMKPDDASFLERCGRLGPKRCFT
jgi:methyltransferase family protein